MHSGVGLLMRIMFSISVQHQIAIEFLTHLLIVAMELSSAQTQMENCGIKFLTLYRLWEVWLMSLKILLIHGHGHH